MNPMRTSLSRLAKHFVQFNPGTDVLILNAMMHTIIKEDLTNKEYIAKHTKNFDAIKASSARYSPESISAICGIEAKLIKTISRLYAKADNAIIFWGMGISQHTHGTDNARCLIALALMCGQIGRPGTGLHPLRGQNNVQGASDAGLIPMMLPDYQKVDDANVHAKFSKLWETDLATKPGKTVTEVIDSIVTNDLQACRFVDCYQV
jgi:formate dehydrogenase major subunit